MDVGTSTLEQSRGRILDRAVPEPTALRLARRARPVAWAMLITGAAVSAVSIVQSHGVAERPAYWAAITTWTAIAAIVALVWACAMAVHTRGSRGSDATVVVGMGALAVAIGTVGDIVIAQQVAAAGEPSSIQLIATLDLFGWVGLATMIGALGWRAALPSTGRGRVIAIVLLSAAPLAAAASWNDPSPGATPLERLALLGLAALSMSIAWESIRRSPPTSILESHTGPAALLSVAIAIDGASAQAGDLASIAALGWLATTGLVVIMWLDREAQEQAAERRQQTLSHLQRVAETRQTVAEVRSERLTLGHNGSSSLLAIEGAVSALAARLDVGIIDPDEGRAISEAVLLEVQRLRRSLSGSSDTHDSAYPSELGPNLFDASLSSDPTSVAAAIEPVVTIARASGARVIVEVPTELRTAARSDVLSEMVANLLDNAAHHAPGAIVTIVGRRLIGGSVELTVADDGPGIDPSVADSLFERGVTSGPHGSGLGLYSARELARLSGGELSLRPSSAGASFVLHLPPPAVAEPTGEPAKPTAPLGAPPPTLVGVSPGVRP